MNAIMEWFDITKPEQVVLVVFGLIGQVVFFCRWIIQWLSSEAKGESHMPVAFWWCSLIGATMLFTYFVIDRDPVGMLGQCVGWTIYGRNLILIRKKSKQQSAD